MMRFSFAVLILFVASTGVIARQRVPSPAIDSLLTAGIDLTLKQAYQPAMEVFRRASQTYPDHPVGALYQMAVLQAMAMDYEEVIEEQGFDSLLLVATQKSQSMIEREPASPWGYYFLGTAFGHDSFARAQRGDWFGTLSKGLSAVSQFETAIERDSAFSDAFLGLGTYFYWKSRKIEFLTWLPFVGDQREQGIRLLQRCAESGVYNRYAAMSALVSIYVDAGKEEKAIALSSQCLQRYPENRVLLWGKATALDRKGMSREAISAYESLLGAMTRDKKPNLYNELVCRLRLASLLVKETRLDQAEEQVAALLKIPKEMIPEHLKTRGDEKIREGKDLGETIAALKSERR